MARSADVFALHVNNLAIDVTQTRMVSPANWALNSGVRERAYSNLLSITVNNLCE